MSEYLVQPGKLTDLTTFHGYRDKWDAVIAATDPTGLITCFSTAHGHLLNYVFLPVAYVKDLINTPGTTHIQAVFVAVPTASPTANPSFTVVLIPIDEYGNPTSDTYYLAGVAKDPASLGGPPDPAALLTPFTVINNHKAYNWTNGWSGIKVPGNLTLDLFASGDDKYNRPLRGYTYTTADFRDALGDDSALPPDDSALWINFALHGDAPGQFALTLCLNKMPEDNASGDSGTINFAKAQHFFDLSRPCPPCCYASMPLPFQARADKAGQAIG